MTATEMPSSHDSDAVAAHAAAGQDLIPIDGKVPVEKGWRRSPSLSLDKAKARMAAGRNVGVRLRDIDLVIDVDPRHFAAGDDPLVRLKADFGLPFAPLVKTGGGGLHLYLRKPADAEVVNSLPEYAGIEFKSLGRQVVAAGSIHPETGKPYSLDDDPLAMLLSEAPEATTALLDAIAKHSVGASEGGAGEITPGQLELLLSRLDVIAYSGRHDDWLRIMMSSHYGTAGAAVDEFVAWSISDPDYAHEEARIRDRWSKLEIKPEGVKLGTLLKALSDAGHGAWIEAVLRSPPEEDFADAPEVPQTMADLALATTNLGHFTVLHGGKYLVGRERRHPTLGHIEVEWFSSSAVSAHLDSRTVETDDGKARPLGSWWVKHPRRRQYDGVVFDPAPDRTHARLYNLWRGWAVEPKPGDWSLFCVAATMPRSTTSFDGRPSWCKSRMSLPRWRWFSRVRRVSERASSSEP